MCVFHEKPPGRFIVFHFFISGLPSDLREFRVIESVPIRKLRYVINYSHHVVKNDSQPIERAIETTSKRLKVLYLLS